MSDLLKLASPYAAALCRGIAGPLADDAAQEALIVVFRRLDRLDDPHAFRPWLRTICVREALRLAAQRPEVRLDDAPPLAAAGPDTPELRLFLSTELARLPADQCAVLILREVEGLSEREIAQIMRIAQGTVKSRLSRAKRRLQKAWRP